MSCTLNNGTSISVPVYPDGERLPGQPALQRAERLQHAQRRCARPWTTSASRSPTATTGSRPWARCCRSWAAIATRRAAGPSPSGTCSGWSPTCDAPPSLPARRRPLAAAAPAGRCCSAGGWPRRQTGDERGQGLVELSAVLPIILILLVGMLEFGMAYNDLLTIGYASREGARAGSALAKGGATTCTPVHRPGRRGQDGHRRGAAHHQVARLRRRDPGHPADPHLQGHQHRRPVGQPREHLDLHARHRPGRRPRALAPSSSTSPRPATAGTRARASTPGPHPTRSASSWSIATA